jgi:hypothetical protein
MVLELPSSKHVAGTKRRNNAERASFFFVEKIPELCVFAFFVELVKAATVKKMIQDVSPKIFAKTLAREPRFKQVLGVKEDQKKTEKPEQKIAKEQLRQESLRRDSMRDLMGMEYEM